MKIRKRVSAAKIDANRKNAKKPKRSKSQRDKDNSKRNAIRHGICTRDLLLPEESEIELEELWHSLIESYCPVGFGEHLQVQIILTCIVRLRRLHRAETGDVTKRLADRKPQAEILASAHFAQHQQAIEDRARLDTIENELACEGRVSKENLDWVRALPCGEPVDLFVKCIERIVDADVGEDEVRSPEAAGTTESPDQGGAQGTRRTEVASPKAEAPGTAESPDQGGAQSTTTSNARNRLIGEFLRANLDSIRRKVDEAQAHHGLFVVSGVTAQCNMLLVPGQATIDRLLRYEAQLLRNLYRAEHALERMQRLRLGDEVPAPTARVD